MTALRFFDRSPRLSGRLMWRAALATLFALVAACGSGDAPPPPDLVSTPPTSQAAIPPTITQQPASLSLMPTQSATFTVAATGTMPLTYQWQRNGVDIAGATSATYTIASVALTDSGATFRVIVTNVAGSATSNDATLTVTMATPTLTIAPQPSNVTVTAGASASFTVGGTCSSGTLTVQWQRLSGQTFVDIAGATSTTYSFMTTTADNGAQFRAVLTCSGAAVTTSNTALLTVNAPAAVTLSQLPVTGLRSQAPIGVVTGITPSSGGGWDFTSTNAIRHLAADQLSVTLVAGGTSQGSADGPAATATFNNPLGVAEDGSGTIYVADTNNDTIRVVSGGTVSTLAGTAGMSGLVDGAGAAARFSSPSGIALGPDGDLYVVDRDHGVIRRVTTAGVVTTYAGSGTPGFADGPPATAQFSNPSELVVASNGDVYVADTGNARVRRIVRSGNVAGSVVTLAGSGSFTIPGTDGPGLTAGIPGPTGIALNGSTLYVLDFAGTIRTIDVGTAVVATFAGSRTLGPGYADGPLGAARFDDFGGGIALQPSGGLVVADSHLLRTVDTAGNVTTIASAVSTFSSDTGTGVLAQLPLALDTSVMLPTTTVVTDASNRVVVSENVTRLVRRIDTTGAVSLVAGLAFGAADVDGRGSAAEFVENGLALAVAPDGTLYTSDDYGVRRIATDGTTVLLAGSSTTFGAADGPPTTALFNRIGGLAVGPTGDVFVGDFGNSAIRRVDAAGNTTTYAGALGVPGSVDGPRATARFQSPHQLVFAPDGSLYVVDFSVFVSGSSLRRIAPDGTVSTVPGGDSVIRVAVDPDGTLYVVKLLLNSQALGILDPTSGAFTTLISTGTSVVLGNVSPSLGLEIGSIYMHGLHQIVVSSGGQLLLVTRP